MLDPAAQAEEKTAARCLLDTLVAHGVDTVFGYPGGAIMPLYDALPGSGLRHILCRHEQGAALAAVGYARASGRVGVCFATSGPGATNLVTGLADAFMDSVPLLAVTGQVAEPLMGSDAFQEVDTFGLTLPVVKHSYIARRGEDLGAITAEALDLAGHGRPGPVLIDLPKDVASQRASAYRPAPPPLPPLPVADEKRLAEAERMIARARQPVCYIGGGVEIAGASNALRDFIERNGLPAVSTLKGLGCLPTNHPRFLGMLGMHGNPAANHAVQASDLLLVVGARFDDRATGKLAEFAPAAQVIHLDADAAEVGKLRSVDIALIGDLGAHLDALDTRPHDITNWQQHCQALKAEHAWRYDYPGEAIYAPGLLRYLSEQARDPVITCDVGQHQMWVAQHCRFPGPRRHLSSGGLGTMGFGIPAGLGAQLACPERQVITVTGDGSVMMNIQELATLGRYHIPLKILVLDNAALGMVRQWQELFFQENYSEVDLYDNPDFATVAQAFGLAARRIHRRDEVAPALDWLLGLDGPALLHVLIDPKANVWPLVPPGTSNTHMIGGQKA